MNDVIGLAQGQINRIDHLVVQFVRPADMPAADRTLARQSSRLCGRHSQPAFRRSTSPMPQPCSPDSLPRQRQRWPRSRHNTRASCEPPNPPRVGRSACNLPQTGTGTFRSALEDADQGGGRSVAEWFMLFVFGISAASAVAALYARHEQ
jgi:hypothetical protein